MIVNAYRGAQDRSIVFNDSADIEYENISIPVNDGVYIGTKDLTDKVLKTGKAYKYLKFAIEGTDTNNTGEYDYKFNFSVELTYDLTDNGVNGEEPVEDTKRIYFYPSLEDGKYEIIIENPGILKKVLMRVMNMTSYNKQLTSIKMYGGGELSVGAGLSDYYMSGRQTALVIPTLGEMPEVTDVPQGFMFMINNQ